MTRRRSTAAASLICGLASSTTPSTDFSAALKLNSRLASALYGRGLAKQKKGDTAGGQVDMAAANLIQSDIAEEFAGYGVK